MCTQNSHVRAITLRAQVRSCLSRQERRLLCVDVLCSPAVPQPCPMPLPLPAPLSFVARLLVSDPQQLQFTTLDVPKRRFGRGGEGYGQGRGLRRQNLKIRFGNVQDIIVLDFINLFIYICFYLNTTRPSYNNLQTTSSDRVGGLCKHSQIGKI